jgi:hypothetical protein
MLTVGAITANAGSIIYSNLGNPAQFDDQNGWVVDGGVVAGQMLAVAFTPGQTVQPVHVQVAMGIVFTNLTSSPIDLYLAADAAGLPGSQIVDLQLAGGQNIGPFLPGNLAAFICGGGCPMLTGGTQYWLVAQVPNLSQDHFETQAEWNWNFTNNYVNGSDFAYNDTQFNAGWVYGDFGTLRPAFEIDAVPEPGSLSMLASGLLTMGLGMRRRPRNCSS